MSRRPDGLDDAEQERRRAEYFELDPRDTDPLHVPEDVLWDPLAQAFVPRSRPPLLVFVLGGISGAIVGALLMAVAVNASPPSPPAPSPSFVPVPGATMGGKPVNSPQARGSLPDRTVGSTGPSVPAATPTPRPTPKPTPRPKPAPVARGHVRSGIASWYRDPKKSGLYAAAGPPLRVGDWRGRLVTVTANGHSFLVRLSDWCACRDRVIDLSPGAFSRLSDLSRGLVVMRVTW